MTHTYKELSNFFEMRLELLAKKLNYSKSNILVLEGNEEELKNLYPDVYANILSCIHNRDGRSPMEYARDLVSSWIFEDYMVQKFHSLGYNLYLSGKDKERVILPNSKVGSDSDVIFKYDNHELNIEIMNDYSNYWERYNTLDLRDNKFDKLLQTNSVLLAVSLINRTYSLIPINEELEYRYIPYHKPYGGKPAYQINLKDIKFYNFKIDDIIENLKDIIKRKK
ncbi:MAG: hypothetical protein IKC11_00945 [Clostridia bacterium]|nr:hypothetical protein [Clostridia bacterium]